MTFGPSVLIRFLFISKQLCSTTSICQTVFRLAKDIVVTTRSAVTRWERERDYGTPIIGTAYYKMNSNQHCYLSLDLFLQDFMLKFSLKKKNNTKHWLLGFLIINKAETIEWHASYVQIIYTLTMLL